MDSFDPTAMSFGALGGSQQQQSGDPLGDLIKKLLGYAFASSLGSDSSANSGLSSISQPTGLGVPISNPRTGGGPGVGGLGGTG